MEWCQQETDKYEHRQWVYEGGYENAHTINPQRVFNNICLKDGEVEEYHRYPEDRWMANDHPKSIKARVKVTIEVKIDSILIGEIYFNPEGQFRPSSFDVYLTARDYRIRHTSCYHCEDDLTLQHPTVSGTREGYLYFAASNLYRYPEWTPEVYVEALEWEQPWWPKELPCPIVLDSDGVRMPINVRNGYRQGC